MDEKNADLHMDVLAYALGLKRRTRKELQDLEQSIKGILTGVTLTELSRHQIESLIVRLGKVVDVSHATISALVLAELAELSAAAARAVSGMVGAKVKAAAVEEVIFLGSPVAEWWKSRRESVKLAIARAIRTARVNNLPDANNALFGKKGVFEQAATQSDAVVEGAALATETQAKRQANSLLSGFRASAMFDSKTCLTCAALDGELFDQDMQPRNKSIKNVGAAPFHTRCRCVMVPELAVEGDAGGIPGADGNVSRGITFEDWIGRKSKKYQESYFGKGRYELWKKGDITLNDLINGSGKILNLDELASKYP